MQTECTLRERERERAREREDRGNEGKCGNWDAEIRNISSFDTSTEEI